MLASLKRFAVGMPDLGPGVHGFISTVMLCFADRDALRLGVSVGAQRHPKSKISSYDGRNAAPLNRFTGRPRSMRSCAA